MAHTQEPLPVKLIIAVLYKEKTALECAQTHFTSAWGAIDFEGAEWLFDKTDYYAREMGAPLFRRIVSFEKLASPNGLVDMKIACNGIEAAMTINGGRTINCDSGYLDHNKIILASAKAAGQKIYIDKGIYADLTGRYKDGRYRPFEWTFPDFKDDRYSADLVRIRSTYLSQLKKFVRIMEL